MYLLHHFVLSKHYPPLQNSVKKLWEGRGKHTPPTLPPPKKKGNKNKTKKLQTDTKKHITTNPDTKVSSVFVSYLLQFPEVILKRCCILLLCKSSQNEIHACRLQSVHWKLSFVGPTIKWLRIMRSHQMCRFWLSGLSMFLISWSSWACSFPQWFKLFLSFKFLQSQVKVEMFLKSACWPL